MRRRPRSRGKVRVVMVLRGTVRDDPRALKEANSLVRMGARIFFVAARMPGEETKIERVAPGIIAVRTTTGLWSAMRGLVQARIRRRSTLAPKESEPAKPAPAAATHLTRPQLVLMLASRLLLAVKFAALTLRMRPDVVHAHDLSGLPGAWLATRFRRVPLIYDAHEINLSREGYYRQLRSVVAGVEGGLIRDCAAVITTTSLRARYLRRVYHLSASPHVLQNRPPLSSVPEPAPIRAQFGLKEDELLCIYQGGLQHGRGLGNMIRALATTRRAHLLILGSGPQAGALTALARELGVHDRIHFRERVPFRDVAAITAAADVGLQLLRHTCFNHWSTDSNKLFEYAQAGLAVVASNFPEIRHVVARYDFGLLVDPDDVSAIAQALARLRDDADLLIRYRRQASSHARELSWLSQEPKLQEIYRELWPSHAVEAGS